MLIDFRNVWQAMGTSGCQEHFSNDMQVQYTITETVETCLNAVQTTSIKNTLSLMSQIILECVTKNQHMHFLCFHVMLVDATHWTLIIYNL